MTSDAPQAAQSSTQPQPVEVCWRLHSAQPPPRTLVCAIYRLPDGSFEVRLGYGEHDVVDVLDRWSAASIVAGRAHAAAWKRLVLQQRGFQEPDTGAR